MFFDTGDLSSKGNQILKAVSNTLVMNRFKCILVILAFFIGTADVLAQDSRDQVDCQVAPKFQRPKKQHFVSFGVINGRARILVKPEYPATATFVNVRGTVNVSVLIDPRGCVDSAKTTSGHPFLRTASVRAALKSSFEPILLGGNPVWAYGVIVYNYID